MKWIRLTVNPTLWSIRIPPLFLQLIEELEEQISEMRTHEANQQQRELRKLKMTYEILARNELNAKLAEINTFLEDRAAAQADNERRKEKIMDEIQKDLGDRLQKSRDELTEIKKNMMGKNATIFNVFFGLFNTF